MMTTMLNCVDQKNKGFLKLSGPDRSTFLQGLVAGNVETVTEDKSIYTILLTPQGKFLFDLFITQIGEDWFIETQKDRLNDLLNRLKLYKLRSQIHLEIVDYSVFALWGDDVIDSLSLENSLGFSKTFPFGTCYLDPRHLNLGARLIIPTEKASAIKECLGVNLSSMEDYTLHRLKLGIPESEVDLIPDKSIPLECGLNDLHAIDWEKGCYMGQELTARTRYRGLIRKHLIPVCFDNTSIKIESPILQENINVGEMRSSSQGYGLAFLRLECLTKPKPLMCENILLKPFIPDWMNLPKDFS